LRQVCDACIRASTDRRALARNQEPSDPAQVVAGRRVVLEMGVAEQRQSTMRQRAARLLAIVALAALHVLLLLQLFSVRPAQPPQSSAALNIRFIDPEPPPTRTLPGSPAPHPTEQTRRSERRDTSVSVAPAPGPPAAPSIDWWAEAQRAAAAVATDQPHAQRDTAEPSSHYKAKPFPWDKTRTERVTMLPQGGTRIRLSEKCALVIAPLPIIGCGGGQRTERREDLFDGMNAPAREGDWQDSASVP
jgi:hypothetical protein